MLSYFDRCSSDLRHFVHLAWLGNRSTGRGLANGRNGWRDSLPKNLTDRHFYHSHRTMDALVVHHEGVSVDENRRRLGQRGHRFMVSGEVIRGQYWSRRRDQANESTGSRPIHCSCDKRSESLFFIFPDDDHEIRLLGLHGQMNREVLIPLTPGFVPARISQHQWNSFDYIAPLQLKPRGDNVSKHGYCFSSDLIFCRVG